MITPLLLALLSGTAPKWFAVGDDPKYPAALYVLGTGSAKEGQDAALARAQASVGRQVRARVRSVLNDNQSASRLGDARFSSESSSSQTRTESDLSLTGIQVVRSEQSDGTWYVEAALDKTAYSEALEGRISELEKSISGNLALARSDLLAGKPSLALEATAKVEKDLVQLREFRALRLDWSKSGPDDFQVPSSTLDSIYQVAVGSLSLKAANGADQTASLGKEWPNPVEIQALASASPVSGLPITVFDLAGSFVGRTATDAQGRAAFWPPPASGTPGRCGWIFKPRLDVPRALEPSLQAASVRVGATVLAPELPRLVWRFEGDEVAALEHSARQEISKRGVKTSDGGKGRVTAAFKVQDLDPIQGYDKPLARVRVEVSLSMESPGRSGQAGVLSGTGMAKDRAEALRQALGALDWNKAIANLAAIPESGARPRKIGVVVVEAPEEGESEAIAADELSAMIQSALGRDGRIELLERRHLDPILHEAEGRMAGLFDASAESLRLSGADAVVLGEVRSRGRGLELEIRVVDVGTGRILSSLGRVLEHGPDREEVARIAKELVSQAVD